MSNDPLLDRAVVEFSQLKPRTALVPLTTVIGQATYPLPTDAFDVVRVETRPRVTAEEALSGAITEQCWATSGPALVLSPAPTEEEELLVVYHLRHHYDPEVPQTNTLDFGDDVYVADLRQALFLEVEADALDLSPSRYAVGQMEFEQTTAGLRKRAADIRRRVHRALSEPLAAWG